MLLPGATPAFKPPSSSSAAPPSSGPIESTFEVIKGAINEDVVKSTQGIYCFDLSGITRDDLVFCPNLRSSQSLELFSEFVDLDSVFVL